MRLLSCWLLILFAGFYRFGYAEEEERAVLELPIDQVRLILHPWANESEIEPDRRAGYDLISIQILPSGRISTHLPPFVHGTAWLFITARGYQPVFIGGGMEFIKNKLANLDSKVKTMPAGKGSITGVTYNDMQGRGVSHPVSTIQKNTVLTFTSSTGLRKECKAESDGHYVIFLDPGKYHASATHTAYEGAKPENKDFTNLGWIEVNESETTILDLILSTLYVD